MRHRLVLSLFLSPVVLLVILSLLALPAATLPATAAPVPRTNKSEILFCASNVGDRLVHQLDRGLFDVTEVVTKVERESGGMRVTFEWEGSDGKRTPARSWLATTEGLQVAEYAGQEYSTPMWDLKLPHREGNRWSEEWPVASERWYLETAGWEEVKVPAGTFRAMRVERTEITELPEVPPGQTTYWYAPGVGCIKWESGNRCRELKSFERAK